MKEFKERLYAYSKFIENSEKETVELANSIKVLENDNHIIKKNLKTLNEEHIRLISALKDVSKGTLNQEYYEYAKRLEILNSQLAKKLVYYGKNHPDIISLGVMIRMIKEKLNKIPPVFPANNEQIAVLKSLIDENSLKIERYSDHLAKNKSKLKKNYSMLSLLSSNKKHYYDSIKNIRLNTFKNTSLIFENALNALIFYILSAIFLLVLLEKWDTFYFYSYSYTPDIEHDIIFVMNKDINNGKELINKFSIDSRKILIADLFPEAGMFMEFSEDGKNSLDDVINGSERFDFNSLKKGENLFYSSIRPGIKCDSMIESPSFHKALLCLKEYFDFIIVHMPKISPKKDTLKLIRKMGKIKIFAKSLTHNEIKEIDDFAEVLIQL